MLITCKFLFFILYFSTIHTQGYSLWKPSYQSNYPNLNVQQKMQLFYKWKQIEYEGLLDFDGMYNKICS